MAKKTKKGKRRKVIEDSDDDDSDNGSGNGFVAAKINTVDTSSSDSDVQLVTQSSTSSSLSSRTNSDSLANIERFAYKSKVKAKSDNGPIDLTSPSPEDVRGSFRKAGKAGLSKRPPKAASGNTDSGWLTRGEPDKDRTSGPAKRKGGKVFGAAGNKRGVGKGRGRG